MGDAGLDPDCSVVEALGTETQSVWRTTMQDQQGAMGMNELQEQKTYCHQIYTHTHTSMHVLFT